jgi:hypothetical protein
VHASQQLTPCPWKGHYETGHDLRPFGQLLLSPPLWPSMAYAASGRKRRAPLRCAHEILLLQSWFHPLQRPVVNNFFFLTGNRRGTPLLRSVVNNGFRFLFYWILIDGNQKEELYIAKCFP